MSSRNSSPKKSRSPSKRSSNGEGSNTKNVRANPISYVTPKTFKPERVSLDFGKSVKVKGGDAYYVSVNYEYPNGESSSFKDKIKFRLQDVQLERIDYQRDTDEKAPKMDKNGNYSYQAQCTLDESESGAEYRKMFKGYMDRLKELVKEGKGKGDDFRDRNIKMPFYPEKVNILKDAARMFTKFRGDVIKTVMYEEKDGVNVLIMKEDKNRKMVPQFKTHKSRDMVGKSVQGHAIVEQEHLYVADKDGEMFKPSFGLTNFFALITTNEPNKDHQEEDIVSEFFYNDEGIELLKEGLAKSDFTKIEQNEPTEDEQKPVNVKVSKAKKGSRGKSDDEKDDKKPKKDKKVKKSKKKTLMDSDSEEEDKPVEKPPKKPSKKASKPKSEDEKEEVEEDEE